MTLPASVSAAANLNKENNLNYSNPNQIAQEEKRRKA